MNFYSQLPELHHLTCRSLWDLTWVTFVYRWISPWSTSSTLTVRSVPIGCTRRVFRALRGKRSVPQATSHHRLTRWRSSSAMAFPVAEWSLLFGHTRTTPTGLTWVLSTGDLSLTSSLSQPPSECWQISVTTAKATLCRAPTTRCMAPINARCRHLCRASFHGCTAKIYFCRAPDRRARQRGPGTCVARGTADGWDGR
jgi:hypothetical protein